MKINFNRSALSEALALLTSVVPSRTPKPILRCVKINADADRVQISATDLEIGINCVISGVEIAQPGEVVIPADRLAAIVRESVDDVLSLEASAGACEIKGSDSHFTIFAMDAAQYPEVPAFDGEADFEVNLENIQTGVEQTLFATAKESTRYALNGVLWEIQGRKLNLVATDGRRLVRTKVSLKAAPEKELPQQVIVPAKTMALLDKVGRGDKDLVQIKFVENQIVINCEDVVISSNLVDGNFPKYDDIIPTDHDKKITLNTAATLSAVKRSALLTSEESRGIKLAIKDSKLTFSSRAPETGDAQIEMPIEYSGEDIEIGFNPAFLVDILRVIDTDQVELELGQSDRPGVIKSGANLLYVLMPINLG